MSFALVVLHNDQVMSVTGRWPDRFDAERAARDLSDRLRQEHGEEPDPFASGYVVRVAPVHGMPR